MVFFSTMLASIALPILAAATPIDLDRRAGGPSIVPLAANCTLMNPLPHASLHPGNGTISGYVPSPILASSKVYSWYIPQPDFLSREARWSNCVEQCNGFHGCVSAYMAFNAPLPKGWLGLPGGELEVGCFMYNRALTPLDFVVAEEGHYVNATAGNIYCPKAGVASASASASATATASTGNSCKAKSTAATKKTPVKIVA